MIYEGGTDADRAAIAALHRADQEASRRQDFGTLRKLMSDDAVVLAPGTRPLRGRTRIDAAFARPSDAAPAEEVLSYAFEWQEVRITGDFAFEWGRIIGESRPRDASPDAPPTRTAHNVLRILCREGGAWKVHRTIWNDAPL